jgi:hypothetical protein
VKRKVLFGLVLDGTAIFIAANLMPIIEFRKELEIIS